MNRYYKSNPRKSNPLSTQKKMSLIQSANSRSRQASAREVHFKQLDATLKECLCVYNSFSSDESKASFVVKTKIIGHLVDLANTTVLKLPHLEEETEYAPLAERIADIYLKQSRVRLDRMSRSWGGRIARNYGAIVKGLRQFEDHMKTIKISCKNVTVRSQIKTRAMTTREESHKNEQFSKFSKTAKSFFLNFERAKRIDLVQLSIERLTEVIKVIVEMCNYFTENAEYISKYHEFRRPSSNSEWSFMQTTILKITQLLNEVETHYQQIRAKSMRSNVELRKTKCGAIISMLAAQQILCKYYQKFPVEAMPLNELMARR